MMLPIEHDKARQPLAVPLTYLNIQETTDLRCRRMFLLNRFMNTAARSLAPDTLCADSPSSL